MAVGVAKVAELVDAQDSGSCGRKPVGVRLPPFAPTLYAMIMTRSILLVSLLALFGCRTDSESEAYDAFKGALERQETAIQILEVPNHDIQQALKGLKSLRSEHGDDIIYLRENKNRLMKELSDGDEAYFHELRNDLFQRLNDAVAPYPTKDLGELRHVITTL